MDALRGLALLLLCQSAGEVVARGAHLPLPGPVLGMLLMLALLAWPAVRAPVGAAADALLTHLSLLFVPVGVGVVTHLAVIGEYAGRLAAVLLLSTVVGLVMTALTLRALLPATVAPGAAAASSSHG
ncbi:MAG: CidA/LrgA family protein [Betaproteobacteria bacterium]|nr:CidA/LrgA family protein [Betaproteobacteria bacterium]